MAARHLAEEGQLLVAPSDELLLQRKRENEAVDARSIELTPSLLQSPVPIYFSAWVYLFFALSQKSEKMCILTSPCLSVRPVTTRRTVKRFLLKLLLGKSTKI
jgi:hypothetical protein